MTHSSLLSQKVRASAENYQLDPGSPLFLPAPLGCFQPSLHFLRSQIICFLFFDFCFTFFSYLDKETLNTQREDMDNLRLDVFATENSGDHRSVIVQNEKGRALWVKQEFFPSSFSLACLPPPVVLRGHGRIHLL